MDSKESSEFFITIEINVNLDGINYIDSINWDLLDKELIPETFAENTVKDENLPEKFITNSLSNKERYSLLYI